MDPKALIIVFLSFSGGLVISGAIYAFITIVGVVPSIARKTKTEKYIKYFEECIIFGGIFGCTASFIDYGFNLEKGFFVNLFVILFSTSIGVFYGVLAGSLAETLDVIPVLSRRARLRNNIYILIIVIGIGKLIGSILYHIVPEFQI